MATVAFEPGDELCPPMWSELLWQLLHKHPHKVGGGGGDPGDPTYVKATSNILTALSIHALSFSLEDQKEAQGIRSQAEGQIIKAARQMGAGG